MSFKPPEYSLGHKMENPGNKTNCVKKQKLAVPFVSFKENCAQTRTFSNTPFTIRELIFFSMGQKKDLHHLSCIEHLFKYVVIKHLIVITSI